MWLRWFYGRRWHRLILACLMFTKGFTLGDRQVTFIFKDFIAEDETIYMISGLDEPLFMGYSTEEQEWHFLNTVPDQLFEVEEEFSEAIAEQEAVEDLTSDGVPLA